MLEALCRLYYREADWDGSWWGTRPDTSGPYYKRDAWDQTEKISHSLRDCLAKADDGTLRFLLEKLELYKINLPDLLPGLIQSVYQKPQLRPVVVELAAKAQALSSQEISFLESVVLDRQAGGELRERAFHGFQRGGGPPEFTDAAVGVLARLSNQGMADTVANRLRDGYIHDPAQTENVSEFEKLAWSGGPGRSELAFAMLAEIAMSEDSKHSHMAQEAIKVAWKSAKAVNLLQAVGETHADCYLAEVRSLLKDPQPDVAVAAAEALREMPTVENSQKGPRDHIIARLPYEQVVREATSAVGDPKAGARLFEKLSCVKCHTTLKGEPLKGPFLGDITARYKKPEIIESILRPSAQIAQGFTTTTLEMKDGSDYDGFVVLESGDEIELRNLAGARVLQKKDIVKRGTGTKSIMPEGLADQLTPEELASLLAFLQSLNPKS